MMTMTDTEQPVMIYWQGTEDQQHAARMKACKARRKIYGKSSCDDRDGSCPECTDDMAVALRIPKTVYDRAEEQGLVADEY